jgi:hypothetical protein
MRLDVLTVMTVKSTVSRDVMRCSLVEICVLSADKKIKSVISR